MATYTIEGIYKNRHVLTIEAPDEDTAVQIFYQQGGGDPIDGEGWDDIEVDVASEEDEDHPDYTAELNYDPEGPKIIW